jgi:hypothetical protein
LQSTPQLMPVGFEVTVPVPVPALVTSSDWLSAKVAVIVVGPVIVVVHEPVPLHAVPCRRRSSRRTASRAGRGGERQLAAVGHHRGARAGAGDAGAGAGDRAGARAAEIDRHQVLRGVERRGHRGRRAERDRAGRGAAAAAPGPAANSAPVSGVAVSVTMLVDRRTPPLHCVPQLMPPGFEVTVPVAVPSRTIVRFTVPGRAVGSRWRR